jgi:hypothetical protein
MTKYVKWRIPRRPCGVDIPAHEFEGAIMNKIRIMLAASILPAITIAGGCGEIAYKTGAGADALQADQRSCKQGGNDPIAYRSCMRDKGWAIANIDGSGVVEPDIAPTATVQTASAAPLPNKAATAAPAGPVKVSGWFKFGGGGPQDDIAACVATLGSANQPDAANGTVTPALLVCMKKKGWNAL